MIRDGINFKSKRVGRKGVDELNDEVVFNLANGLRGYLETGEVRYLTFLRNPYSILFIISPYIPDLDPDKFCGDSFIPMEEFYNECLKGGDSLYHKVSRDDWDILVSYRDNVGTLSLDSYVKEMSRVWDFDSVRAMEVWEFQPDPISFSFTLGSSRLGIESFTPVIGVKYVFDRLYSNIGDIRFPCIVLRGYKGRRVQIHKDGSVFKVFCGGEEIDFVLEDLVRIPESYVIEGVLRSDGSFIVYDILCWNDIWLFNRPFGERWKYVWHFFKFMPHVFLVNDYFELWHALKEFDGFGFICNLNEKYGRVFFVDWNRSLCVLEVGGIKHGGGVSWLKSVDGFGVFKFNRLLSGADYGKKVYVNRNGEIYGLTERPADSWVEVAIKFGFVLDYDEYREQVGNVVE